MGGNMKLLSEDDLRLNQQASAVAASVLSEAVEAAARCEQVNADMKLEAAGVSGLNRGLMRGMKKVNRAMMPSVGNVGKELETAGLPQSFVLAVTASKVYAIEDKHDGDQLAAGKILKSWDREGFQARSGDERMNVANGVPEDRQVLTIFLPIEGGKGGRYQEAMARNTAAAGSPGMPHRVMLAKDAPGAAVIKALVKPGAVPNIMIGGQSLQDMMAQAGAATAAPADPADQLTKLAALRDRGLLTDEEFATEKAKILASS
jgi:Short C-terminal domain